MKDASQLGKEEFEKMLQKNYTKILEFSNELNEVTKEAYLSKTKLVVISDDISQQNGGIGLLLSLIFSGFIGAVIACGTIFVIEKVQRKKLVE